MNFNSKGVGSELTRQTAILLCVPLYKMLDCTINSIVGVLEGHIPPVQEERLDYGIAVSIFVLETRYHCEAGFEPAYSGFDPML